ncbi:fibronectin type III domain-containing protein [Labilibaculum euxinus]
MGKKIFTALLCFLIPLGVLAQVTKVTKTITPVQAGLPVVDQANVKGGYHVAADLLTDDIASGKKETGMIAWDLASHSHYRLSSSGWQKILLLKDWEVGSGFYSGQLFLKNNQLYQAETDGTIAAETDPASGSDWVRVGVEVEDVPTSTSAVNALSANQGKLLNDEVAVNQTKLDAYPLGSSPGQILYWDGTAWIPLDAPEKNDAVLQMVSGVPVWVSVPDAPIIGTAAAGTGEATVAYTAPADNGGSEITSYTATSSPGDFTGTVNQAGSGSITVPNLANGTAYTFTVTAINAVGNSVASAASNSIIPAGKPDAPLIGVATAGDGEASIAYTAPANNGGSEIISYTATSSPGGFTGTVNQAGSGSITVSGLTNGTAYTFTVIATNSAKSSEPSAVSNSIIPFGVPDAPLIGNAIAFDGEAEVAYTAPADNGGSEIISYTATSTPGGFTGTVNQAGSGTIVVSGLSNATAYTFTVTATNALGTSVASAASNSVTPEEIPVATSATGRIWMDRNLGASHVATSINDDEASGYLYQWGRGNDGHQLLTSGTTNILSSSDEPGHGDFITVSTFPKDWRSPQNDALWQGVDGINNPCPKGFRLPTVNEVELEMDSWTTRDLLGAFASPLKWSYSSYRISDGSFVKNPYGYGWTSGINGSNFGSYFAILSAGTSTGVNYRGVAYPVRCIKD